MVMLSKHMNILSKYGLRSRTSSLVTTKLLRTPKVMSRVFILSSNHHYSTLQTSRNLESRQFLNLSFPASHVSSSHLSTSSRLSAIQASQNETIYIVTSPGSDGSIAKISTDSPPSEFATSASEILPIDQATTFLPTEELTEIVNTVPSLVENVEVPLSALGLAGWTPVGFMQRFLELIHVHLDLPWWSSIVVATFIARVLLFPVLIKAQQNAAKFANIMPQLQVLQSKFNHARRNGNAMEASRYGMEINLFMKKNEINPFKNALIPLCQAPVFVSFFLGLRSMAKLPVESFKTGGFSWITDLTIADPYYITPLITCGTLYIVIKVGAESGVKLENMKIARYVLTALPVVIFPFMINFPAAVLCYWCANNFLTLGAVSLLKIERVRELFKIPKRKPVNPSQVPEKKGFIKGVKEAYEDQRMLSIVAERSKIDEVRFRKAGVGPIPRTYSYDPTKPRPATAAAARKTKAKEHNP